MRGTLATFTALAPSAAGSRRECDRFVQAAQYRGPIDAPSLGFQLLEDPPATPYRGHSSTPMTGRHAVAPVHHVGRPRCCGAVATHPADLVDNRAAPLTCAPCGHFPGSRARCCV